MINTIPGNESGIYPEQLFRAKLNMPALRTAMIFRERIGKELDALTNSKLGFVIAPAGYGKTTAVIHWLKRTQKTAAWFSIDSFDNSLKVYWNYMIAAFGTISPVIKERYAEYFNSVNETTVQSVILALTDELYKLNEELILVLDDYHFINESSIHDSMALFINYLPDNLHIIIISRTQPPFNSIKLQARGHIREIGTDILKFNAIEISDYFYKNGISADEDEVGSIEQITEGWITGLYLMLDSLRLNRGYLNFEKNESRQILKIDAYLTDELMNFRTQEERAFLLKTSILSSLNGELCDALTERADGTRMLRMLYDRHALVISLDGEGNWFRYHHLFSEFLKKKLGESGIPATPLHEAAGEWYEKKGFVSEAVGHYLKGCEFEKAAALIENKSFEMIRTGEIKALSTWLEKIPTPLIKENDMLSLTYAWALSLQGKEEGAAPWIEAVESKIKSGQHDERRRIQLETEILAYRGIMGLRQGDPESIIEIIRYGQRRAFGQSLFFACGINLNHCDASLLAGILGFKGRLRTTEEDFAKVCDLFRRDINKKPLGYLPALTGEIFYERGDFEKALERTLKAMDEAEESKTPGCLTPVVITLAKLMKANGDVAGAFETVKSGRERLKKLGSIQMLSVLDAFTARLNIEINEQDAVGSWIRRSGFDILEVLQNSDLYKYLTYARALILFNENDRCAILLGKLLLIAQKDKNIYYTIEIAILQALNSCALGQTRNSMESLRQALILGEREGYERIFVEEGAAMAKLLRRFASWSLKEDSACGPAVSSLYVRKLMLGSRNYCAAIRMYVSKKAKGKPREPTLHMPLTRREKEVLALLDSELSNAEISYLLDITVNTVKVNCSNIYRKLDVRNREQAIKCARELKLLS